MTVLFKYDYGTIFWGLEYEDAYAFSFLAREFANGIYTQSFLSEGIGIGSLDSPVLMQTYGGHFITYSVLLSLPIRIFGFSFTIVSITTSLLQFFSLLILSTFYRSDNSFQWIIAPTIYCISPIINVFGNSFLCEPFSGLLILSYVYLFYKHIDKSTFPVSVMIAFFVAIITKRENLILIIIPIIHYGYLIIKDKKLYHKRELITLAGYCSLVLIYFLFIQNVFNIESSEAQDIEASTFSFQYFRKLAPTFISSLLNPLYFGITTIMLICLIARSFYLRFIKINEIALLACWILYFLLYTFHYRGYFFVQGERVCEFDSFRYLNNYYCLTPLIAYSLLSDIKNKKYIYIVLIVSLLLSVYPTIILRKGFNDDEWYSRFYAPYKTLEILKEEGTSPSSTIIISPEILTLQNIGNKSLFVCDAVHFDKLNFTKNGYKYYMLCRDGDIEYLRRRFGAIIDISRWTIHTDFGNGFILYKYYQDGLNY